MLDAPAAGLPSVLAATPVVPEEAQPWVNAALAIALALAIAWLVDRGLGRHGRDVVQAVAGRELTPEAATRLNFVRRLLAAAIVLLGVAVALGGFDGFSRLATSLLASGAIAAAVLGFAARQTLANLVAGVMIAVTQPLRVGDWVTFEGTYGEVEDVRLNYTYLRTPGDQRVIIPNEKLASGILRNDTLATGLIEPDVSVWVPAATDASRAIAALADETGHEVSVAETRPDGVRLAVAGAPVAPSERSALEARMRTACVARLRADGLLPGLDPPLPPPAGAEPAG